MERKRGGANIGRKRSSHTRSRIGCIACRTKHVRCDERRPACLNCFNRGTVCEYGPPRLFLRDRRAQKKAPQPWQQPVLVFSQRPSTSSSPLVSTSWQVALGPSLDPFDALAIKMPFKSRELFYYFFRADENSGTASVSGSGISHVFASIPHDAYALRNTLLIASMHYTWNVGNLHHYEATFHFHKTETIRMVNAWLQVPEAKKTNSCVAQIVTLLLIEFCTGNIEGADTHLEGLLAVLDSNYNTQNLDGVGNAADNELMSRYIILTASVIFGCRRHLYESPAKANPKSHQKNKTVSRSAKKARTMSSFPYFFVAPPACGQFPDIDAYDTIRRLRDVTDLFVQRYVDMLRQGHRPHSAIVSREITTGPLDVFINTHISSFDTVPQTFSGIKQRLVASWSALTAASALYLHSVIGVWHTSRPVDRRLHRHLLLILKRDIEKHEKGKGESDRTCDLLFWMNFTAAFSLTTVMDDGIQELYSWFCNRVFSWRTQSEVSRWLDAKAILSGVVWPASHPEEIAAEMIWNTAADPECH